VSVPEGIRIETNPKITPDQLFSFYERNRICEVGYGKETASRVLTGSSLIVAAFEGDELVGIVRAMFDGVASVLMEFSLDVRHQGRIGKYRNGSLIEHDDSGLGKAMGSRLLDDLRRMGSSFVSFDIVEDCEEPFYTSLGFSHNKGHLPYYIDERPYVK